MYTDAMVDIETGDTDPARGYVFQIAAVKFNRTTREVSSDIFDRCLLPATQPNRRWNEDTREWWSKRQDVLHAMLPRMEHTYDVLQAFSQWTGYGGLTLWAKPTHFEHPFLQSLYKDHDLQIPFHYRTANDVNSFARGVYWPNEPPNWEKLIEFTGSEHSAIDDVWHQLRCLYKVLDRAQPT